MVTEKSCNLSEYPYTEKTYTEKTCHYVILSHNTEWIKKFNITALLLIWERLKQWKKKSHFLWSSLADKTFSINITEHFTH